MSSYHQITRHPQTGQWEKAFWIDDYFGHHIYGVEFKSDKKVYPVEIVERRQLTAFWHTDVIEAFKHFIPGNIKDIDQAIIEFLNTLESEYKKRWKRDPSGGEGAVEASRKHDIAASLGSPEKL